MDALRQGLSVLVVFALLGAAIWALRREGASLRGMFLKRPVSGAKPLELVARVVLTPQHCLHIVRAGGREWVVATHPHGCSVIDGRSVIDGCSVIAEGKAGGAAV